MHEAREAGSPSRGYSFESRTIVPVLSEPNHNTNLGKAYVTRVLDPYNWFSEMFELHVNLGVLLRGVAGTT